MCPSRGCLGKPFAQLHRARDLTLGSRWIILTSGAQNTLVYKNNTGSHASASARREAPPV